MATRTATLTSTSATTFNITQYGGRLNPNFGIQRALAIAKPGDTLFFPDGSHLVTNTIKPQAPLEYDCVGPKSGGNCASVCRLGSMFDLIGLSGVQVSFLTVDATGNQNAIRSIYAIQGDHFNLQHPTPERSNRLAIITRVGFPSLTQISSRVFSASPLFCAGFVPTRPGPPPPAQSGPAKRPKIS